MLEKDVISKLNPMTDKEKLREFFLKILEINPRPINTVAFEAEVSPKAITNFMAEKNSQPTTIIKIKNWMKKQKIDLL